MLPQVFSDGIHHSITTPAIQCVDNCFTSNFTDMFAVSRTASPQPTDRVFLSCSHCFKKDPLSILKNSSLWQFVVAKECDVTINSMFQKPLWLPYNTAQTTNKRWAQRIKKTCNTLHLKVKVTLAIKINKWILNSVRPQPQLLNRTAKYEHPCSIL